MAPARRPRSPVATSRRRGTPVFEAYELLVLAHALRDAGQSSETVDGAAAEANELAERLNAGTVVQELERRGLVAPFRG